MNTHNAQIRFSQPNTARLFCRTIAGKGALAGSGFWSTEKWLLTAERWARQIGVARASEILAGQKAKGVKVSGMFCSKCGAPISAPESVAAGMGPECMKDGAI